MPVASCAPCLRLGHPASERDRSESLFPRVLADPRSLALTDRPSFHTSPMANSGHALYPDL